MRGIFCQTTATTNEEYKKELKSKNLWMVLLILLGAAIAVAAYLADAKGTLEIPSYMLGVYCGMGTGIAAAGVILLVKNLRLLGNEEKLKASRLENYDERNKEIKGKAVMAAVKVMLTSCLVTALIAGIYYPYLIKVLLFILYVFLFSYLIAYSYYKRKM